MGAKFDHRKFLLVLMCYGIFYVSWGQEIADEHHHDSHEVHTGSHLSAFVGYTVDYNSKTGYKIGLEYEYRLNKRWGLATAIDFVGADFEIIALSVGGVLYPFDKFPLALALGIGAKHKSEKWHHYYRGVLAYDFHLGKVSLSPTIIHDFYPESKDITSYGVQIGISL
ncbi:hypothetical protein [Lutimonas sp.]|uniref:hypothetical protein n=1 Tax=Lutimonas sp. TaxID=1872403 RepID=UPI003D9BA830